VISYVHSGSCSRTRVGMNTSCECWSVGEEASLGKSSQSHRAQREKGTVPFLGVVGVLYKSLYGV